MAATLHPTLTTDANWVWEGQTLNESQPWVAEESAADAARTGAADQIAAVAAAVDLEDVSEPAAPNSAPDVDPPPRRSEAPAEQRGMVRKPGDALLGCWPSCRLAGHGGQQQRMRWRGGGGGCGTRCRRRGSGEVGGEEMRERMRVRVCNSIL